MKRPERGRLAKLRSLMAEKGVEALLVTRREDVRYLSGFTGSAASLLVASDTACLITDFRYKTQSRAETRNITVLIQKKDAFTAIRDAAGQFRVKTLWFDASDMTVMALKRFRQQGLSLKAQGDLVRVLRQRKDDQELGSIRHAIRRAEDAFCALKPHIKAGATERGLGRRLEDIMRDNGSRKPAFDTIVASGPNGAMPHATVTDRRLRKGDLVTFDFGAEAGGYFSDLTRTVSIGRPTPKAVEIHSLVLRAQEAAMQSVRIGTSCKAVDAAARGVIADAGYGREFGHGTGHGIGLMVHEGPWVSPLSQDRVEKGMVFTVEPGVYIPGWGGVRIEDMVLATEEGARLLTSLPKGIEWLNEK